MNFIQRNKLTLLSLCIAILALLAFIKIFDEFFRLVLSDSGNAAIDLKVLKRGINLWFSNRPILTELKSAIYPPTTYAMLWPFIGWIDFSTARVVMSISFIPSLLLTAYLFLKNSLAKNTEELFIAALIPLSINAVGVTIGNGQLGLHVLLLFVFAILLLKQKEISFPKEILISIMILFSLIKPSVTAPFLWILLLVYPNRRVIFLTILSYALLTFVAFYFRDTEIHEISSIVSNTIQNIKKGTVAGSTEGGYGNLHSLLAFVGLQRFNLLASAILFFVFGIWVYIYKKADIWLLLAVTAIFSRLWMYHRVYDDILLIVPMITLFRLVKLEHLSSNIRQISLVLLIITTVSMLALARLQFIAPWS